VILGNLGIAVLRNRMSNALCDRVLLCNEKGQSHSAPRAAARVGSDPKLGDDLPISRVNLLGFCHCFSTLRSFVCPDI
jgi:hypothetical protein